MPLTLSNGKSDHLVTLGTVEILFSYDSCVAFRANGAALVDPTYRGYSATTSKHLTGQGFKNAPDAKDGAAFKAALAKALKKAL